MQVVYTKIKDIKNQTFVLLSQLSVVFKNTTCLHLTVFGWYHDSMKADMLPLK